MLIKVNSIEFKNLLANFQCYVHFLFVISFAISQTGIIIIEIKIVVSHWFTVSSVIPNTPATGGIREITSKIATPKSKERFANLFLNMLDENIVLLVLTLYQ